MEIETKNKITLKIFAGFLITSEMKNFLNHSLTWKQVKITAKDNDLKINHYHDKDYIGLFLENDQIEINELKKIEQNIQTSLQEYIPDYPLEKSKVILFSQVFVS